MIHLVARRRRAASETTYDQSGSMGAEIVGVSLDSVDSHKKILNEIQLPFPLVSDKARGIGTAYGVLKDSGTSTNRVTFIIDKKGKIAKVFPKVDVSKHTEEVVTALKEFRNRSSSLLC